jgi:transposase
MTFHLDRQKFSDKSRDELLDELEKAYKKLEEERIEKERLEKELRKYKNPNTPPSAHPHLKPDAQPKTHAKRGAPIGHVGTNRPVQEADEQRLITQNTCPNGHAHVAVVGSRKQQIEEFPPDIKPKIIDVIRHKLQCKQCGVTFWAKDGRTPLQGRFGLNLIVLTLLLKFVLRGVLRKTAGFLEHGFAFTITPSSVNAIVSRASDAVQNEYEALKQKIREARIVYSDETSISVLGMKWWVWAFRTDTDVLLVIRHSRGNDVPKEVLGVDFRGIVVCDGWRAYDCLELASIQRCWAHLLRKSAELETAAGKHFHARLKRLFDRVDRFNRKPRSEAERLRKYEQLTNELREVTAYYARYPECEAVCKYVGFRLGQWFTCVRLEGVEPTNNFAEQAVRESVIVRKIIGAFRSIKGVHSYEVLASLIATWNFQKRDVGSELKRALSVGLC